MTPAEMIREIENLGTLVRNFHAVKGIRAWAAEENIATKRELTTRIDVLIAKIGATA